MADGALLSVRDLCVRSGGVQDRPLVDGVSFDVGIERVALVGESGSGKSLTARALLGLVPAPLSVKAARLQLAGEDLRSVDAKRWTKLRGKKIALVLQDARFALNPVLTVGRQIDEMLVLHGAGDKASRRTRARDMLEAVGLAHARVAEAYPHQLSGGMAQRVMLAMMLVHSPQLLIADEPTSALDAALREQILALIASSAASLRMGLLLISHNLREVSRHCDRVLVMYRGRIVDQGPVERLATSDHPYTRALWAAAPSGRTYGTRLPVFDRDNGS